MDYKTVLQWEREGRYVRDRQKAMRLLVSKDGTTTKALFGFEQTVAKTEMIEVKKTDRPKPPKNAVYYTYDGNKIRLWVGPRQDLIARLKAARFRFDGRSKRWWKVINQPSLDAMLVAITDMGYTPIQKESSDETR